MERARQFINTVLISALLLFVTPLFSITPLRAGTRFIPPPPPRGQQEGEIQEYSYWGTLQDDEGREVNFNQDNAFSRASRSPAGLETAGVASTKPETLNRPAVRKQKISDSVSATEETMQKLVSKDSNDPLVRRKGIQEVAVIASESGFYPKTFFVSRDVPVRLFITGASRGSLCLMMDSFNVRKQIRANKIEEITFTPNEPGTYRFYCPVNGGEGTMVVKELASSTETQTQ